MSKKTMQAVFTVFLINTLSNTPIYAGTRATVCSSPSLTIPSNDSTGITNTLNVDYITAEKSQTRSRSTRVMGSKLIDDINVFVDVSHDHVGELVFNLEHDGTQVTLIDGPGYPAFIFGCVGQNLTELTLDDEGSKSIENDCIASDPAYNNAFSYQPNGSLSDFDGKAINGDWTLTVTDNHELNIDDGTLNKWCLEYERESEADTVLEYDEGTTLSFENGEVWGDPTIYIIHINSDGYETLVIYSAEIIGDNPYKDDFKIIEPDPTAVPSLYPLSINIDEEQTFYIACTPSTGGLREATLRLETNVDDPYDIIEYPLSCTGLAASYYSATLATGGTIDFGTTQGEVVTQTFDISETGGEMDLSLISATITGVHQDDFRITSPDIFSHTIDKDSTAPFSLECEPKSGGVRKALLTLRTNDPDNPEITYHLKCTAELPVFKSTPSPNKEIVFGTSKPPTSVIKNLAIKNAGLKDMNVTVVKPTGVGDVFTVTLSLNLIPFGKTAIITITCQPSEIRLYEEKLVLTTDDPSQPIIEYPLSCSGTDTVEPLYDSVPEPDDILHFGSRVVGTSVKRSFNIREVGNDFLNVDLAEAAITGINANDFEVLTNFPITIVDGGDEEKITVQCTPTAGGLREATLNLVSTDESNNLTSVHPFPTYTLKCNGKAAGYDSTPVQGSRLDFGSKPIRGTATKSFNIKEIGEAELEINLAETPITGLDASDFSIDESIFPIKIADGGAEKIVTVKCTPSALDLRTAELNLITNDPSNLAMTYRLECRGKEFIGTSYTSTPPAGSIIDFGSTPVGAAVNKTFDIHESGTVILGVDLAIPEFITGTHWEDFEIISPEFPFFIPNNGDDVTVTIQCKPSDVGLREATLHIISTDESNSISTYDLECTGTPPPLIITVEFGGIGQGEVNSDPAGIDCDSAQGKCAYAYYDTPIVHLIPTAADGSKFSHWEGSADCSDGRLKSTDQLITNNPLCIAYFESLTIAQLTVTTVGNGSVSSDLEAIDCVNDGDKCTYPIDAEIILTAIADSGWQFDKWEGECNGNISPTSITLTTDKQCQAVFVSNAPAVPSIIPPAPFFDLTVEKTGSGIVTSEPAGIDCGTDCAANYSFNIVVTLTATPQSGAIFTGWGDDCGGSSSSVTVSMNKASMNCTAHFLSANYTLAVTKTGKGTVTSIPAGIDCGAKKKCRVIGAINTPYSLIATPANGFRFAGFGGDCDETSGYVVLDTDKSCTVRFEPRNTIETDPEKYSCSPTATAINSICNFQGQISPSLVIVNHRGNISNVVLDRHIENQGWISNATLTANSQITGGILTGYINNHGILIDIEFRGGAVKGGTLSGNIVNSSPVDGAFEDVYLSAGTRFSGKIGGKVTGDPTTPKNAALLKNATVKAGSYLSNVTIGNKVTLGEDITYTNVKFQSKKLTDGTLAGKIISHKRTIISGVNLVAGMQLVGGRLQGEIKGDPQYPARLDSVTIEGSVSHVIIGQKVINKGTITDSEFRCLLLSGGTLSGHITNTFAGTIEDVRLGKDMTLSGGYLAGEIIGDANGKATLMNVIISAGRLENVIIADNVRLAKDVKLGSGVRFVDAPVYYEPTKPVAPEPEKVPTAFAINPQGQLVESDATFIEEIETRDGIQVNHTMFSYEEAKSLNISATVTIAPEDVGKVADILMVAIHKDDAREANSMRETIKWVDWDKEISHLETVASDLQLPSGSLEIFVYKGDLSDIAAEFTFESNGYTFDLEDVSGEYQFFLGYQLEDGTLVYNGVEPIHFFVDSAPEQCIVYAVHDGGLNDSQFIQIDLSAGLQGDMQPLGPEYRGRDIEGLALHPDFDYLLYGSAGNETQIRDQETLDILEARNLGTENINGYVYTIHRETGELSLIGPTGFDKVSALAFHPINNTLWAWARSDNWSGIITIDPETGVGTPFKQFDHQYDMDGLAFNPEGSKLYVSGGGTLWVYDLENQTLEVACEQVTDGKIEGLDMQPNGFLLMGLDVGGAKGRGTSIFAYDPERCQVVHERVYEGLQFYDIESIVWPASECNYLSWLSDNSDSSDN
jgi:subtilisin-like proprotein convertase family protein